MEPICKGWGMLEFTYIHLLDLSSKAPLYNPHGRGFASGMLPAPVITDWTLDRPAVLIT